jgi:hypothetical protein
MSLAAKLSRQKISTTISSLSLSYLERLIEKGEARTLADAIDSAVQKLQIYENRERLANDTAAYFERMSPEEAEEEARLGAALASTAQGIDFDREP